MSKKRNRQCSKCNRWLDIKHFRHRNGAPVTRICWPCARLTSGYDRTPIGFLKKNLRTARYRGVVAPDVTPELLLEMFEDQNGLCALSGIKMTMTWGQGNRPTNVSLDRIDPTGSYTRENIRLVCWVVNMMRRRMSDTDLIYWCAQIVRTTRKNKT